MKELRKRIIDRDGIRYIGFPDMEDLGIRNVMTTRDLNMAKSKNTEESLADNYEKVKDFLGLPEADVYVLYQEHTDKSIIAGTEGENERKEYGFLSYGADGLITDRKGTVIVATVADCVPVVLYDVRKGILADIHSGWKGTLNEICGRTIERMKEEFGTDPEDITAFIGPHIQKDDFEVRSDVESLFRERFPEIKGLIERKSEEHYLIDLNLVLIHTLTGCGVPEDSIFISQDSTVSNELYHSYRRDGQAFGIMSLCVALG